MKETKFKFDWKIAFQGFLIVVIVLGMIKLHSLSNEISSLRGQLSYYQSEVNNIRSEISLIYNNVEEQLKKEASMLSSVDYELGELDSTAHTAEVLLKVVPKDITDDMQLSVSVGNETAEFVREGNAFTSVLQAGIFLEYGECPMLSIKTAEGIKTESLESVDISYLHYNYLPIVMADIWGSCTYSGNTVQISGGLVVDCKASSPDCNITISKMELVTELNGKEIDRKDVTTKLQDDYAEFSIEEKFEVAAQDALVMYIEAEDTAGYIHRSSQHFWMENDNMPEEIVTMDGSDFIYDRDGNLLNVNE